MGHMVSLGSFPAKFFKDCCPPKDDSRIRCGENSFDCCASKEQFISKSLDVPKSERNCCSTKFFFASNTAERRVKKLRFDICPIGKSASELEIESNFFFALRDIRHRNRSSIAAVFPLFSWRSFG